MNTTAAIFFLVLGQAPDGFHATGSSMAVIPHEYASIEACEDAGKRAQIVNQGLAFLSFTCVFAEKEPVAKVFNSIGKDDLPMLQKAINPEAGRAKCDGICELIEAAE